MIRNSLKYPLFFYLFSALFYFSALESRELPPATESIYDELGFISSSEISELRESAERFMAENQAHVQIFLINSLEGEDVCGFTDKILNASQTQNPKYKSAIYLFSQADNFSCLRFHGDLVGHFSNILYDRIYYNHFYKYQNKGMYYDAVKSTQTAFFNIITDQYLEWQKPEPIESGLTKFLREANEALDKELGEVLRFAAAITYSLLMASLMKFFLFNNSFGSKFLFIFLQPLFGALSFVGLGNIGFVVNLGLLIFIPLLNRIFTYKEVDKRVKIKDEMREMQKEKSRVYATEKSQSQFEDPFMRKDTYHSEEENEERFG